MSEASEMYEGIEVTILEMIEEYKNLKTYTDEDEYKRIGSISALETLLDKLNE